MPAANPIETGTTTTGTTSTGTTGGDTTSESSGAAGNALGPSPFLGLAFGLDDVEVRFCDRKTGVRLFFNPDWVTGLSVELTEAGGVDTIRVQVAALFDAAFAPVEGCSVEVVVLSDPAPTGRPEPWPRYRGILSAPEASLAETEARQLIAYGFMEDMVHVPLTGSLIAPGGGDIAQLAAQALAAYSKQRGWLIIESAIGDTGVAREIVDVSDSDCRKALDTLVAQAPGLLVWGWRVNALTGANQFVFQARQSVVGNQFSVGANVEAFTLPKELNKVANAIRLTGGPSPWPNLIASVTADNTSFEKSEARGAAKGGNNLVADYSFEQNDATWTYAGGANSKADTAAYAGKRVLELVVGSGAKQTVGSAATVAAGHTYIVSFQGRKNGGGDTCTGSWKLTWKSAGGGVVGSPVAHAFAPAATAYEEVRGAEVAPTGAASVEIEIAASASGTGKLLVDTVALFDKGSLESAGWEVIPHGSAAVELLDPNYTADFCLVDGFGRTCLRVRGTFQDADKQDGFLRPYKDAEITIAPNQSLRAVIRLKLPPGTNRTSSGRMLLVVECRKDDGTVVQTFQTVIAPGALSIVWQAFSLQFQNPSAATKARYRLVFRGDIDVLVDCAQLRDNAAGDEYVRGANWERAILAEDVCDAGTPAYLSAASYDRRTSYVKNDALTQWNGDAQVWAKAYSTQSAVPPVRAKLSLSHEAVQRVDPLDGLLVRVSGLAIALPDTYASRVSLDFSDSARRVQIELGGEQPTLARLIAGGKDQKSVSAGGGSASVTSAISTAIANTLPGVYAAQDVAAEVASARTRDASGGWAASTWNSLKEHLGAVWAALGVRTADPAGQAAGRVLTTDGANGVAWADGASAGVTKFNLRTGDVRLVAGDNITITEPTAGSGVFYVSASASGGGGSGGYDGHVDVQIVTDSDGGAQIGTFDNTIVYRKSATSANVNFVHAIVSGSPNYYGRITFVNATNHSVSLVLDSASHWGAGGSGPTLSAGQGVLLVRTSTNSDAGAVWFVLLGGTASGTVSPGGAG